MTNDTVTDGIWEIISNTEAIAVNQAWFGDSGEHNWSWFCSYSVMISIMLASRHSLRFC
jgi:choline-glycine betaine transporter